MISSHLISPSPFGVYPSVSSHAPGSLIKCGEAWWCVHRGYQITSEFTRHDVARSKIRTSIQISHTHPQFTIRSRIVQNSPELQIFHPSEFPVSSTITVHLAIMSKPSTERNSAMPLPAFFVGRWLLAEHSDAMVCFCQPSSVEIELNAMKLP